MAPLDLSQVGKRLLAWGLARANDADDRAIVLRDHPQFDNLGDLKRALLGSLRGRVLEIGPGAGANFRYYSPEVQWIGIEPNPFMHRYLQAAADRWTLGEIELHVGGAETLPLPDASLDAAVSTHVLCSATDPERAIAEIRRALKPGAPFVFLEHVAAEDRTWTRRVQNGLEPAWKTLFDNCRPNRETGALLARAGFGDLDYRRFELAFPVVSPHIAGTAIAA